MKPILLSLLLLCGCEAKRAPSAYSNMTQEEFTRHVYCCGWTNGVQCAQMAFWMGFKTNPIPSPDDWDRFAAEFYRQKFATNIFPLQ